MSIDARLSKIERNLGAGTDDTSGGTLVAERSMEGDGAPAGMFRCYALDGAAAGFTRTEAELERIADEQHKLLILVLRESRPIAPVHA